jgi:hypothetical protein
VTGSVRAEGLETDSPNFEATEKLNLNFCRVRAPVQINALGVGGAWR